MYFGHVPQCNVAKDQSVLKMSRDETTMSWFAKSDRQVNIFNREWLAVNEMTAIGD